MFCIIAAIFMMPLLPRDLAEPEPEADSEAAEQTVEPLRTFNKEAVYCFLSVCIGHTLRLLDDAEYDGDHDKAEALNGIYDSLEDRFVVFERDGISSDNLQIMMQAHDSLREIDTKFNCLDLLSES